MEVECEQSSVLWCHLLPVAAVLLPFIQEFTTNGSKDKIGFWILQDLVISSSHTTVYHQTVSHLKHPAICDSTQSIFSCSEKQIKTVLLANGAFSLNAGKKPRRVPCLVSYAPSPECISTSCSLNVHESWKTCVYVPDGPKGTQRHVFWKTLTLAANGYLSIA